MIGRCYAVVDSIAEKVVVYFHAVNEKDASRFLRVNFGKSPEQALEGLLLYTVHDWSTGHSFPEPNCSVVDILVSSSSSGSVSPADQFKHEVEEAMRSGAYR